MVTGLASAITGSQQGTEVDPKAAETRAASALARCAVVMRWMLLIGGIVSRVIRVTSREEDPRDARSWHHADSAASIE